MTSEHKVTRQEKGRLKTSWKKEAGKRNEPFDLFNYNYAVLELMQPEWDVLEEKLKNGVNYMKKSKARQTFRRSTGGIEV